MRITNNVPLFLKFCQSKPNTVVIRSKCVSRKKCRTRLTIESKNITNGVQQNKAKLEEKNQKNAIHKK